MELLQTTHLIDAAIALFLGYMAWKLRNVEGIRTDIAVIKTTLEQLPIPTMQSEIQRNRHKIADLDKGLAAMGERLKAVTVSIESIKSYCNHNHGGNP
jgi:hypothetical protein